MATRFHSGKLFGVATLVGFDEKRCRKNLPLSAPSMFETFDNSRVLWRDTEVGHIERVGYDFPRFYGHFVPGENIEQFRELFTFLMDEDADGDPPFAADLLNDDNWWIVPPNGDRIGIFIPAIDLTDLSIDWRER